MGESVTEQNAGESELTPGIVGDASRVGAVAIPDAYEALPTTPAGWHTDPRDAGLYRFWNGSAWTDHTSPKIAPPGGTQQTSVHSPGGPRRGAKTNGVAYLLAILLGGVAAHRFYLGRFRSGFAFLVLFYGGYVLAAFAPTMEIVYFAAAAVIGACVWWLVDLVLIPNYVQDANKDLSIL